MTNEPGDSGEKTAEYSVWAIPGFGFAQPPNGSAIAVGGDWIPVVTSLGAPLSGSYTLLLQLTDSSGNTCYDIQRVWLDYQDLRGLITALGHRQCQRSLAV